MKNKHIGSAFSSFLDEEGIREEVDLRAKKKVLPTSEPASKRHEPFER
ncbi:MAG TPA: hypothetical protein VFE33_07940 [Thermoanaerobaculia bacterium]|nr:hypothetical protein [Thermoanaerobaculia bacterium]